MVVYVVVVVFVVLTLGNQRSIPVGAQCATPLPRAAERTERGSLRSERTVAMP